MKLPYISLEKTLFLLRVYVGITFILHGIARFYYASIADFGAFLDSVGLGIGIFFAWFITLGEIIGGSFLIFGYKTRYVLIFHFFVILTGLVLIHIKSGFFVVGHGQGGVEYSILILIVLSVLYSQVRFNS